MFPKLYWWKLNKYDDNNGIYFFWNIKLKTSKIWVNFYTRTQFSKINLFVCLRLMRLLPSKLLHVGHTKFIVVFVVLSAFFCISVSPSLARARTISVSISLYIKEVNHATSLIRNYYTPNTHLRTTKWSIDRWDMPTHGTKCLQIKGYFFLHNRHRSQLNWTQVSCVSYIWRTMATQMIPFFFSLLCSNESSHNWRSTHTFRNVHSLGWYSRS